MAGPDGSEPLRRAYSTDLGQMYQGRVEDFLAIHGATHRGQVQLVFFSPPFPLNRKKRYGNKQGNEYMEWLGMLAPRLAELLTPDGSLVVEIGNGWDLGQPTMSLLPLKSLMEIADKGDLKVCQQFICHNPARLPTPAQWVTIERIRVKDSYTHVWWMSKVEKPKADNRKVLKPYSKAQRELMARGTYNHGKRDSGYDISENGFFTDHGGAIPPNVFTLSNTRSGDAYRKYCREHGLPLHPAPMQRQLVEWFIKFLTDPGDLVFDPFGGSNMTGAVAEELGRRWVSVELDNDYVEGSRGRFSDQRILPGDVSARGESDTPPVGDD